MGLRESWWRYPDPRAAEWACRGSFKSVLLEACFWGSLGGPLRGSFKGLPLGILWGFRGL